MRPDFDQVDADILRARLAEWDAIKGPRVGDFVLLAPNDLRRFTYDWHDSLQTTIKGNVDSSFYFGGSWVSFSGSLDPALPKCKLRNTGELRDGRAWFFHHDFACAHNGVWFTIPCRVYEYLPQQRSINVKGT